RGNIEPATKLLEHVNAGSAILSIHHQMHCSVSLQYLPQCGDPGVGIRKMMEHSSADYLVECRIEFSNAFKRQLNDSEIVQLVFQLQLIRSVDTRRTEIDARDLCVRPTDRMLRCLRCATSGNQDRMVFTKWFGRPKKMMIHATPHRIVPTFAILLKALDRRRIRMSFVELLNVARGLVGCFGPCTHSVLMSDNFRMVPANYYVRRGSLLSINNHTI